MRTFLISCALILCARSCAWSAAEDSTRTDVPDPYHAGEKTALTAFLRGRATIPANADLEVLRTTYRAYMIEHPAEARSLKDPPEKAILGMTWDGFEGFRDRTGFPMSLGVIHEADISKIRLPENIKMCTFRAYIVDCLDAARSFRHDDAALGIMTVSWDFSAEPGSIAPLLFILDGAALVAADDVTRKVPIYDVCTATREDAQHTKTSQRFIEVLSHYGAAAKACHSKVEGLAQPNNHAVITALLRQRDIDLLDPHADPAVVAWAKTQCYLGLPSPLGRECILLVKDGRSLYQVTLEWSEFNFARVPRSLYLAAKDVTEASTIEWATSLAEMVRRCLLKYLPAEEPAKP